jgi:hypothetical protein
VEQRSKKIKLQQSDSETQSVAPPFLLGDNIRVEPAGNFVPVERMVADQTWDDFLASTELLVRQAPDLPEAFTVDTHKNDFDPFIAPIGEIDEHWS